LDLSLGLAFFFFFFFLCVDRRHRKRSPSSYNFLNNHLRDPTAKMHLMYYLNNEGKRVYTLKVCNLHLALCVGLIRYWRPRVLDDNAFCEMVGSLG
jgi:hypothetical protein